MRYVKEKDSAFLFLITHNEALKARSRITFFVLNEESEHYVMRMRDALCERKNSAFLFLITHNGGALQFRSRITEF